LVYQIEAADQKKSSWHIYIEYKGQFFMLRDWVKAGTWSIETVVTNNGIMLHQEIQNKILKALLLLDKVLAIELEQEIKQENFYLNNAYVKLYLIFKFYESKLNDSIKRINITQKQNRLTANILNMFFKTHEEIVSYCFALMTSFFSLTEFIFDVFYLFEPKSVSRKDFNIKKWDEKFKFLFPIEKNTKLKSLYDDIINIKNNYRNPLTHGLPNRDAYLIPIANKLIPYSYKNLDKVYHRFFIIEKEEAINILSVFNQFLTFIENNDPYRSYTYFIKYTFPIPASREKIDAIRQKMKDFEAFKEYIDGVVRYHDLLQ
jgi:hypothetical protein